MSRLSRAPAAIPETGRLARSGAALPAGAGVFLTLVAFHPALSSPWFSAKAAILLVAGVAGLPLLVQLARGRDHAALAACAFVAWACLAAAVSGSPLAWSGAFSLGTGAVFVACTAGVWAIGRHLDHSARQLAMTGFVLGAAVNAAIAVLQGPFDLSRFTIFVRDGRSTGLMGNPVFLGAVCAGAMALLPRRMTARPAPVLGLAALLGAATQMSGTRVAFALVVVAVVAGLRQAGPARTVALALAVALGMAGGTALSADRRDTNALARLSEGSGALSQRPEGWKGALEAVAERPLIGHGPGRFAAATGPHRSLRLGRYGPDTVFEDAHNLFVEYAVTTGVAGLVLLLVWLLTATRAAVPPVGPELVAAAVLFVFQLVEPQNVAVTPLGFLLLGAAARAPAPPPPPAARVAMTGVAALALVPAIALLAGDAALKTAVLDFDRGAAERAAGLLRPWAAPLSIETRIHLFASRAERRPGELEAALVSARGAVGREPDNHRRQVDLGDVYRRLGQDQEAAAAFARALEVNPWSVAALLQRAEALDRLGRREEADACQAVADVVRDGTRSGSGISRSRSRCLG